MPDLLILIYAKTLHMICIITACIVSICAISTYCEGKIHDCSGLDFSCSVLQDPPEGDTTHVLTLAEPQRQLVPQISALYLLNWDRMPWWLGEQWQCCDAEDVLIKWLLPGYCGDMCIFFISWVPLASWKLLDLISWGVASKFSRKTIYHS